MERIRGGREQDGRGQDESKQDERGQGRKKRRKARLENKPKQEVTLSAL